MTAYFRLDFHKIISSYMLHPPCWPCLRYVFLNRICLFFRIAFAKLLHSAYIYNGYNIISLINVGSQKSQGRCASVRLF